MRTTRQLPQEPLADAGSLARAGGRRACAAALLLLVALVFGAGSATAKEFAFDFGSQGELGGQFSGVSVAVNQASGNVYVNDTFNNRIQQFNADGDFIRAWGWDVLSGGGTGFEVCEVAASCKAGAPGGGAGQLNQPRGVAVDQTGGNLYVLDHKNFRVQQFSASGAFIRAWGADVDTGGGSGFEVCEVAADCKTGSEGTGAGMFTFGAAGVPVGLGVDGTGNVYVADPGNTFTGNANARVQKFTPSGAFLRMAGWDVVETGPGDDVTAPVDEFEVCVPANGDVCKAGIPGSGAGQFWDQRPGALAVAQNGDVYAHDSAFGKIVRLNSGLALLKDPFAAAVGTGEPSAIAVNPFNDHFFLAKRNDTFIYEVDPASEEVLEATDAGLDFWTGLAVNGASGRMYATRGSFVRVFDPGDLPGATTSPKSEVTSGTTATVRGYVNPVGQPLSECAFEYGPTTAYGQSAPCAETPAAIGTGVSPVAVHADLSGLKPASTYHFRLTAANANGTGVGQDFSFKTPGPVIEGTWSEDVGFQEATLKASIDPEGKATTYRFEWGTTPSYGNATEEIAIGSGTSPVTVSLILDGLSPGATYHYRVLATNADATNEGPDRRLTTYLPAVPETDCPNQGFRVGPAAALPNCRAYEMVSPVDKNGGDIGAPPDTGPGSESAYRQASTEGSRVTYTSTTAFGDSVRSSRSNQYLSSRGAGGWSTHSLLPPQAVTVFDPDSSLPYDLGGNFQAFTPDLCFALMRDHNLTPLDPAAIASFTNLYLRDNCGEEADTYKAVTIGGPPAFSQEGKDLAPQGRTYSSDLSHIVFEAKATLESTPPPAAELFSSQIYDFSGGQLHLISVLPNGEAAPGFSKVASNESSRNAHLDRAVSEDGSRIFWSNETLNTLYVRVDGTETVQVSEPSSTVAFWTASVDGARAIYSEGALGPANADLHEFELDNEAKTPIAGEVGAVIGASEDLSRLYFTSEEALAPGATEGERNLYLRDVGAIKFVTTAEGGRRLDEQPSGFSQASRVTADGRRLVFMSSAPLSGYDSTDTTSGQAAAEVYRYDADTEELSCLSCNPSGARPIARRPKTPYTGIGLIDSFVAAAWLPTCEWANYCKRSLTNDGDRVFFNAFDALVPEDVNGAQDVYQWEAPGSGSCDVTDPRYFPVNGGCISLISTGRSDEDSEFLDASADGRDVFITTSSNIHPSDLGSIDVYDARAGGGYPPPPPPPPPCVGDACQSVPAPPNDPTPASSAYVGPGNVKPKPKRPCRKGKRRVSRKGKVRCVAKKRKQRAAKRKQRAGR